MSPTRETVKVVCAPDGFKESMTAAEAAAAMARGVRRVIPDAVIDACPIADGGEGTVDALLAATDGREVRTSVAGPRGDPVEAAWCLTPARDGAPVTAVIEMAAASGMALIEPGRRDPMVTSTFGTGGLIRAALDAGAERILLGIGGSATNDGGCGAAAALGVRFLDAEGTTIGPQVTGGQLGMIHTIDTTTLDTRLNGVEITVACDVRNPLTGSDGAAAIYGPQKGATPEMVKALDAGLAHLAARLRADHGIEIEAMPGAGAAGGMGGGMVAFLSATLARGVDLVLEAVCFGQRVRGAKLCLTGEGRLDGQSLEGKACLGVAEMANRHGVDTVALVGAAGPDVDRTMAAGLKGFRVIGPGLSVGESIRRGPALIEEAAATVCREWLQ